MYQGKKVVVVMPAYNAAKTLVQTYQEVMQQGVVDRVIVVDDASRDETTAIARTLPNTGVFTHEKNLGYGGNQKSCYRLAMQEGADIIIMVHPDYQYTPKLIPAMVSLIASGLYPCVLGSRILGGYALHGGMPSWKYLANRILTFLENVLLGAKLSEYHTGYRAFSREMLERLPLAGNSNDFVFDNQMLAQILWFHYTIAEVTCPTLYFAEASSINFRRSVKYGFGCLGTALSFRLAKMKLRSLQTLPAAVTRAAKDKGPKPRRTAGPPPPPAPAAPASNDRRRTAAICLALAAATLWAFWGAGQCGFTNYDDGVYITSNAEVQRGLTAQTALWAFRTGTASNWHPLTWLSHLADISLYGLDHPGGHHVTSVLLHALNGVLLFLILQRMTRATWRSALVAAFFAVHPLRVESVAWVSERKDVLSTLFWMLTTWAWLRYVENLKFQISNFKLFYGLALVFFALGLMSKPMLVTLPCVLLLLDYWPLGRLAWGLGALALEKIPFFILAAAASVVTFLVQRSGGAVAELTGVPLGARAGNACISYARYLGKIFWPARLSPLYPYPRSGPHPGYWPWWEIAGAVILLAAITGWVLWRRRSQPYLAVGWFWFAGMLVPTIGLVQVGIQSMADRYSYVPAVGIFIMVVWGAHEWLAAKPGGLWVLGTAAELGVAACLLLTQMQVKHWRDSVTLFQHAVEVTEDNYLAYNNLGFDLSNHGKTKEAMAAYQRSLEINPDYTDAHNNMGYALASLGRYKEATNEYIKALSLNSNLTETHNNLGVALGALGFPDAGIHEFQVALQEKPDHVSARNNYGVALAKKGELDEAIRQFRLALAADSNALSAHSDLGNVLALKGDLAGAIQEYGICLKINPKDAQAHNNLANALSQQGKLEEAAAHYHRALELQPQNPEAHYNLCLCLARQGRLAEAEEQCALAVQQRPDYPDAQRQLEALRKAR